ncbi:GGDEF domain-containing protein [Roseateles koreensis]|uniref:diguanylate cyclase n=1 Tax=Roseateles koreensis TaxID=2987526 RepID=A0ABT5KRR6_9BURK|nr:GGDEF domain-containing protein [Roseateles koreensis]MDC8785606.1 GGDEF domain-containing protein [Roseateles koreensis]
MKWLCTLALAWSGLCGPTAAAATASAAPAASVAGASQPLALERVPDPALDSKLNALLWRAFDRPDDALKSLRQLQRESSSVSQAWQLQLAEARIAVRAGDFAHARALADALSGTPELAGHVAVLRAELADRQNELAAAERESGLAIQILSQHCDKNDPGVGMVRGCDFRALWSALRTLTRLQAIQGLDPLVEANERWALALAEAGKDSLLSAISMAQLSRVSDRQQQPEAARRWMVQALQTAQGDALAMAYVKNSESVLAGRRGDVPGQLKILEDGREFATQADAVWVLALNRTFLSNLYLHNGKPDLVVAAALEALPVVLNKKDFYTERILRHNLSVAYILRHEYAKARQEMARVDALREGLPDQSMRMGELRELSEAWEKVGQAKEAIQLYHAERALNAQVHAGNREASLKQLQVKYDSERKQRELDLLTRDNRLKDRQLSNRQLMTEVGLAVAALLVLSLLLTAVMVRRVRAANKRLKANEALLRAQSERDPLTDLANRRHFLGVMELQAQAYFTGALLMIDIDHFKRVNDQHGHAAGDVVICEVARRISQTVRQNDLVVRWGGEEFLVFAAEVSQEQLTQLAQRILHAIGGQPVIAEDGPLRVTASIGFAHFPLPPARLNVRWEQAVNWADMALYSAKAKGRNCAVGIATVNAQDTHALLQIEADFDAACSADRVRLFEVAGPVV